MEKHEYDFFSIGQKHASDGLMELAKIAKSYEKEFGAKAREDFEFGVASMIPSYTDFVANNAIRVSGDSVGATSDYGVENLRNNSYLGGFGVSRQYDEKGNYNEPHQRKSM